MNYKNAKDVFPQEILNQIQKYASGQLIYFSNNEESKPWGSISGKKEKLKIRNVNIRNEYKAGKTIDELCDKYFLSYYSIKKIIYSSNLYKYI